MIRKNSSFFLLAALAVATFSACNSAQVKKRDADKARAHGKGGADEAGYVPGTDVTEASLRGSDFVTVEGLEAVRFDYDSANLNGDALTTLKNNAEYIKSNKESDFLVAGFCDERGTIEYNLALGQKRAKQVREYYMRLGVSGKRLATISYGKENQLCSESSEECWGQNRRAETRARARTASNRPTDQTPQ
ncbi:MAG: OmpA family protein [Elusimicrobia bacterium]|nr:OmpA family protein [Elusimicrobiota bacterium]